MSNQNGYSVVEHHTSREAPSLGAYVGAVMSLGLVEAKDTTVHHVTVLGPDGSTGSGEGRNAESATRAAVNDCAGK